MTGEDDSTTWNGDRRKNSKGTQIFSLGKWASGGAVGERGSGGAVGCLLSLMR